LAAKIIIYIFALYCKKAVKIYTNLDRFQAINPVVTIGTFDGVHLGHRKVIKRLTEIAEEQGGESVIFTFDPHPRLIVQPDDKSLRLLSTLGEKINLLSALGIGNLIVFPFTKEFSGLPYTDFVKTILVDKIKTHCLVLGYDHKFGKNREGDFEYLKECAARYHFGIEKLDPLLIQDTSISSSKIRKALEEGDVEFARELLGYYFMLSGKVVGGEKLGRKIGFPTANIEASEVHKIIPGYGVYAVKIETGGKVYNGMLNIGTRPTFNQNADQRSIEVNIFDFDQDIYGQDITLHFIKRIRGEHKFSGPDALIAQLIKDRESALTCLAKVNL
jgi:riboflavin kinase / FMN adenylyltransferase